jgi:Tfp pilus assembly protein PilX
MRDIKMKKRARRIPAGFISDQSGQALLLVLIFLVLGSLMLIPALDHINTALKTGMKYEDKTDALYAADSGIEDGIYQIKYDGLQTKFGGETAYNYNFTNNASYNLDNPVNGLTTNVTIQNIWIPSNITLSDLSLSAADAKTIIDTKKLVVAGTAGVAKGDPYTIKISFVPASGDNLTIKSVGVWLPQGFTYTMGTSDLEAGGHTYTKIPTVTSSNGGSAVVWTYSFPYPLFINFPGYTSVNGTMSSRIQFHYSPPSYDQAKMPTSAISWVTTEMHDSAGNQKWDWNKPANVPISWDVGTRIYKINSEAGGTGVEAYSSRCETRDLDQATAGDYVAIGNSLMIGDVTKRDNLLVSSNTSISTIPSDADVTHAWLYWSGFRHDLQPFADNCSSSNLTNSWTNGGDWSYNSGSGDYQGQHSGSDARRYLAMTNGKNLAIYPTGTAYEVSWTQSFATVPAVTVFLDSCSSSNLTTDSWQQSGSDWTYDSGSSTRYRGQHLSGDDTNRALTMKNGLNLSSYNYGSITISWSQSESGSQSSSDGLDYSYSLDNGVTWSSNQTAFRNDNPSSSYTHTFSSQNLTGVNFKLRLTVVGMGTATQYVNLDDIQVKVTPVYAASDGLDFSFYDGSSWGSNIQAFRGPGNPTSSFTYAIPSQYLNSNFKMRFYLVGCNSPGQYVNVDTITISVRPPDTQVNFYINEQQVYLDNGNPQAGSLPLTADSASVLKNTAGTTDPGFSYACHTDVYQLIHKYPVVAGEKHHTGNANYRVGDVQADIKEYVSYAGWSLIIVYYSPKTAGHYLYLNDYFAFNPGGINLDFDHDGVAGGDVTGFIIPEPIRDNNGNITESSAAHITCFVGEGDAIYSGDTLVITGATSHNSTYLWNGTSKNDPNYPYNNVWNGASPGCSYPGIDVDTFQALWTDQILMPNDTRLHLDMNSGTDAWNLIYIIVSVRSKTVVGGTEHYVILD